MNVDANDLIAHEGHRLTAELSGREDTVLRLVCRDDDEVVAEETTEDLSDQGAVGEEFGRRLHEFLDARDAEEAKT